MSVIGPTAPRSPTCKLCKKGMVRDHRRTVIRSNGTQMQVYGCDCGAHATLIWKPAGRRRLRARSG